MKIKDLLFEKFENLKIRNKVLLSYILLIFLTSVTLGFFSYKKSSELLEEKTISSTRQAFEQANSFISYKLNNVKDVSSYLYLNSELKEILSKTGESYTLAEQLEDYNRLMEILLSMQNGREIFNIKLYSNNDAIYVNSGNKILNAKDVENEEWYKEAVDNRGTIFWRSTYTYRLPGLDEKNNDRDVISIVRTIAEDDGYGKLLGVIVIEILEENIYDIVKQVDLTTTGKVFLLDDEGVIISSDGKEPLGKNVSREDYYSNVIARGEGYSKYSVQGENSIVYYKQLESTNWRLVAIIPVKEILQGNNKILRDILVIIILTSIVAVFIAYVVSGSITKRIRELITTMKKIDGDSWDVDITVNSTDEIGILQRNFKRMVENIRQLIEEKYQAEINKKSAELRALQAQINPHFLYNILDMICWTAMKYGAEDVVYMVNNLAKFFRLSLSEGKDIVTIRDEISHVRLYLDMQMKRFSKEVEGIIEVEEEIMDYSTVKLILQPIVENAIIHGIMESEGKAGFIKIKGKKVEDLIILTLEDNGRGIEEEKLKSILTKGRGKGYGIKNVNERIKLYFGEEYGLFYESQLGKGTKVTIIFPPIPYKDDEEYK